MMQRLQGSRRAAALIDQARERAGLPPRNEWETYARLARTVGQQPRYQPGTFPFPWGTFRYVDGLSLQYQYLEIFVERGYDFTCAESAPLILDCGGNVGLSVVRFRQCHPQSRIVVYEADPQVAEVLRANVAALNLQNVDVRTVAVWTETGMVSFSREGADSGRVGAGSAQAVPAVRLVDEIQEPISLLKLDIEGAEFAVLRDLYESGKLGLVQRVACEVHSRPYMDERVEELLAALTASGFQVGFQHARSAPDLAGASVPTPFEAVPDGKSLLHLYAWRADSV